MKNFRMKKKITMMTTLSTNFYGAFVTFISRKIKQRQRFTILAMPMATQ
jgi:hypothetical protein